jgi:UDP-N-acetylmuramoyl-L-alanyl-D-glutamate--2,6-diaminopimelate ligase
MNARQAKEILNSTDSIGDLSIEFDNIQYDSRKCTDGSLFVAISGNLADGHDFIPKAIDLGARVIICERIDDIFASSDAVFLIVDDSRRAMAGLAHAFYGDPTSKLKIIGVTGTNGKTTITYLLRQMLENAGHKAGLIGTTGIMIANDFIPSAHTTPESLELAQIFKKMLDEGMEYVIMEASSHALHQGRTDFIKFDAAIFSNLSHEHLDYHINMSAYAEAKQILFNYLPSDGIAVVNGDDEYSTVMLERTTARKFRVGEGDENDIKISGGAISLKGIEFNINFDSLNFKVRSTLLGKFNIENLSLATATGLLLGLSPESIIIGLANATAAPGRMERIDLSTNAIGLVDYSHTPDALEKALATTRNIIREAKEPGTTDMRLWMWR